MGHLIEFQQVYKIYPMGDTQVRALDGVSFSIDKGEFVAIVGQSGSGKSTAMNIIGCLDVPTSGHYFLGGVDVSTMDDDQQAVIRNKMLGFIFQQYNLCLLYTSHPFNLTYSKEFTAMETKEQLQTAPEVPVIADAPEQDSTPTWKAPKKKRRWPKVVIAVLQMCIRDSPGGLGLHVPGRLYHGPTAAAVWSERQGLYSHADGLWLLSARHYGRADHRCV